MFYLAKTPKWVFKLFSRSIWQISNSEKAIYLTFDDGPHPVITPFVLDELDKYGAKATFFCIGKNVAENPLVYKQILERGHAVGNHTYSHLDGWKTKSSGYCDDVLKARKYIASDLFRPPYGRITMRQHKELLGLEQPFKLVMWTVLSGDFDAGLSPEQCYKNVLDNVKSGSVVVFHDSEKANTRMRYSLKEMLKYFSELGFVFKKIEVG